MTRDLPLTRRTAIRSAAVLAGAGVVGGIARQTRGAHAVGSYTLSDPSVLVNDTGDLRWVRVLAESEIHWDGFEVPVTHVGFSEVVEIWNGEGSTLLFGPDIYWGQGVNGGLTKDDHPEGVTGSNVGNSGSPYELDESRSDHDPGTEGFLKSGDANGDNYQVLVAEGGDGSQAELDAMENSAIDTVPLEVDDTFEPGGDGETQSRIVRKTEFAHLYSGGGTDGDLIHPNNGYSWAPTPVVVTGTFEVVVENEPAETTGTSGSGSGGSG